MEAPSRGRSSPAEEKEPLITMKQKHFVIITGGECKTEGISSAFADDVFVIAADSGYDTAVKLGITPDLLVGDMDSIRAVPDSVETLRVKAEKDDTDTMLAISIAKEKGAERITVVGGAGGRADHWLSNIFMLEALADEGIDACLMDGINEIRAVCNGTLTIPKNDGYFGILALDDSTVTVTGCKYPLTDSPLRRQLPYAVSNEVTADYAEIAVRGKVIVTVSKK